MDVISKIIFLVCCFHLAALDHDNESPEDAEEDCVIELECEECIPDNMPLVTSHAARGGRVRARAGDEVALSCGGGRFLLYPQRAALTAECRGGRYRVRGEGERQGEGGDRHLLELGCQEDVFEDVLHDVSECNPPLQGRMYRTAGGGGGSGGARHVAALCFDPERALAVHMHAASAPLSTLPLPPHADRSGPLSLFGNFNQMFDARTRADARRLFADDARLTRRLQQLLRPARAAWAGQTLTSAPLLAPGYFEEQTMRVAGFPSGRVAVWRGVAHGNLRLLQRDVSRLLAARRPASTHVYAGTHRVLALATDQGPQEIYLQPGRFPVPKYIWTVVHDQASQRALAVILLNDPLVAVSEIREAVFCESQCGGAGWLRELRRRRHYERPAAGLVFCCAIHDAIHHIPEIPREAFKNVPIGNSGMLM